MKTTFESYLQDKFMKDAPEEVGDKDSFQDNFDKWLEYQGGDMLIQYAENWGEAIRTETAEMVTKTITDNFGIITKSL